MHVTTCTEIQILSKVLVPENLNSDFQNTNPLTGSGFEPITH